MGNKKEACELRTQKRSPSPNVTSFFKIMWTDHFANILYLPPKFGPVVATLVDQETFIEDSYGQRWRVTISREQDSFAIKKGWSAFVAGNGIERGDLLVFSYLAGSHFDVWVYDKSGCERRKIIGNDKKRKISEFEPAHAPDNTFVAHSGPEEGLRQINGKCAVRFKGMTKMRKLQAPYMEENFVEPDCMINRDINGDEGRIFNLFDLEVKNVFSDSMEKSPATIKAPNLAKTSVRTEAEARLVNKDQVTRKAPQAFRCGLIRKNVKSYNNKPVHKNSWTIALSKSAVQVGKNEQNSSNHLNRTLKTSIGSVGRNNMHEKNASGLQDGKQVTPSRPHRMTRSLIREDAQNCQSAKMKTIVKNEPAPLIPMPSVGQRVSHIKRGCSEQARTLNKRVEERLNVKVKSEAFEPSFTSAPAVQYSCKATAMTQSFLKLSTSLSSAAYESRIRAKRVVYLQDSYTRIWPVLYHDKYNAKLLTSGWEAFSKANSIKVGDECTFKVKSESEGIYEVDISRI